MQFFPHIESGNSSALSSSAGFFADKPTGEGFASFLSSHLDEHGMHGGDSPADQSVSRAQTQDSSESAPSLPDSSPSDFEPETCNESSASTCAATPEDSLEHEISGADKETVHSEFSAHEQKETSANSAAPEARRKDLKRGRDETVAVTQGREKDVVPQNIADLLRKVEPLLESIRRARMEAGHNPDAGKSIRSGQEQITARDLAALREELRDILRTAKEAARGTPQAEKADKSTGRKPSLEVGGDKKVSLSIQERELLQEALARLESVKAQPPRKEPLEKTRGSVHPVSKHETAAMVTSEKTEQKQTAGIKTSIAGQAVQNRPQSPQDESSPVAAVVSEKSVASVQKQEKEASSLPKSRNGSASALGAPTAKSVGQEAVVEAAATQTGEKQMGGKFFRDSASKDNDGAEEKKSGRSTKFDPVASRETSDGGRLQQVKSPNTDGVFTVQSNAAGSLHTSGPAVKNRGAEVYRQVEAGAFRDLGQGNKQLVIRLDPPDLGQVSVILQVRGKEVRAVLRTSNQEASQALSEQLGQLRSRLESQGLQVSRLEVQTQLADSQTESQWQGAEQHNRYQENRELAMTAQRLRSLGRVENSLAQDVQNIPHKENISLTGVDVFA